MARVWWEVFDQPSGNLLGDFDTRKAAVHFVADDIGWDRADGITILRVVGDRGPVTVALADREAIIRAYNKIP